MTQLSRRFFLKNSSFAVASVLFANPLSTLFANSKRRISISWEALVDIARWAPTVHNMQPHLLKIISETEAELYYNPKRLLPVGDPQSVFATVAMGVFIENLSIASSIYNSEIIIEKIHAPINTNATEITLFATLKLQETSKQEILNPNLIAKRRTSRLHYNGKALAEATLEEVNAEAKNFNHQFFYSNDEKDIDYIVDLNQATLFDDLESDANRAELNNLFRYSKEDAILKKDGLWAKCMGFSGGLMKSVFTNHERWTKGLLKNLLSFRYKSSFNGTRTVCWFTGDFENTNDWLNAGRMLARNWLIVTKNNAYLQPFGSLITNNNAFEKLNIYFNNTTKNKKIWLIFRAGYSKEPAKSYRLETNELLIK